MIFAGIAFFVLVGCLFSATRSAIVSISRADRQRLAASVPGRFLVDKLDGTPDLETTVVLAEVSAGVLAIGFSFHELFQHPLLAEVVACGFAVPLALLLATATAKTIGRRFSFLWAQIVAWPLFLLHAALTPVRWPLLFVVRLLAGWLKASVNTLGNNSNEASILSLLERGAATGSVAERERDIVEAVFEFGELTVGRLMTPRPDMFTVPIDTPWPQLLAKCREAAYSRVPVYQRRTDEVIGVLLLKDLLKASAYPDVPPLGPQQLRSLALPPIYVPQSKPANSMLREFLVRRQHMAFVVDEHGTLVGLVTLDDLLTALVGEFLDQEEPEAELLVETAPGTFQAKAWIDLDDLQERTGIALPRDGYNTLGGFIFHLLGRLPTKGDAVVQSGHRYVVHTMEGRRISEVLIYAVEGASNSIEAQP